MNQTHRGLEVYVTLRTNVMRRGTMNEKFFDLFSTAVMPWFLHFSKVHFRGWILELDLTKKTPHLISTSSLEISRF